MEIRSYTEQEFLSASFQSGEPILEGLIYKGQNLLFVAPRKGAKTIFSLQLALCVAHGLPFLEDWKPPSPLKVAYFCFEGTDAEIQHVLSRERAALSICDKQENLIIKRTPYLRLDRAEAAASLAAVLQADKPDLLILDPYYRIHGGGSLNDDDGVMLTTDVLNRLTAEFGHATWLPHHQHRKRHDSFGAEYEEEAEKYAGSWVFGAWCDSMYGLSFDKKTKKARFVSHFERTPILAKPLPLVLLDTPELLKFEVGLEYRMERAAAEGRLEGRTLRDIGDEFHAHPEQVRRVRQELIEKGVEGV